MLRESDISQFLYSRYSVLLYALIAVIATNFAMNHGEVIPILDNKGLGLLPANYWIGFGKKSMWINILLNISIAGLMIYLNKMYNVLRNPTVIFAGMFLILQMPFPDLTGQLYGGTMLCIIILTCAFILFSTYNRPDRQAVFLIFTIISTGTFFQYAFLFYLPVMIIGCIQMRILDLKTTIAAIMGLITPPWILLGFGILTFDNISFPEFTSIFGNLSTGEVWQMLVSIGLSVIVCISAWLINLVRLISYNAQTRAYNGFFAMVSLVSVLFMATDFTNYIIYVPLLNCCTALQLGHLFTIYQSRRSYIGLLSIFVVYFSLYIWALSV